MADNKKKSALEQALLECDEVYKVVTENTKEMLFNQLKHDLDKKITEAIEDDDEKESDIDVIDEPKTDEIEVDEPEADDSEDKGIEGDSKEFSGGEDNTDINTEIEDEPESDEDDDDFGGEEELDLTDADDDKVISVFKKLNDDAEIEVVKDGDNINIKTPTDEFIVKLNEDEDKYSFVDDMNEDEDEMIYEIMMDDDESPDDIEQPIDEVARTHADGRKMERKPKGFYEYASSRLRPTLKESEVKKTKETKSVKTSKDVKELNDLKSKVSNLLNENASLKKDNTEYKEALREMRKNFGELAVLNTNAVYVNKLFLEHATTNAEKKNVIGRFETVKTIDESKTLYKTISNEMKNGKSTISEDVERKINHKANGTTGEPLLESVQTDAQIQLNRVKSLMNYNSKK